MPIIKHFTKIQHQVGKVKCFVIYFPQKRQLFSTYITQQLVARNL